MGKLEGLTRNSRFGNRAGQTDLDATERLSRN
jgi:hypothetical protein